MVPSEGVEPPCLSALGSKPSVSANSTNWATEDEERVVCIKKPVNCKSNLNWAQSMMIGWLIFSLTI